MTLEEAACAYVLARESGRPTTTLYRAFRRAWVAKVRAERLELAKPKTTFVNDYLNMLARSAETRPTQTGRQATCWRAK